MSEHNVTLTWARREASFAFKEYPREHELDFGHGHTLACTAAAEYHGQADIPDPEQAYVAALASCHMLTFLAFCSLQNLTLDSYRDTAVGFLEKGEGGKPVLARIELHPVTTFAAGIDVPPEKLKEIHHKAHQECFLANSVKTEITTVL
ncbi:MAG: OsmC family peroxiredoxin [Akkermansiaceae bacterium]|nr:OsmC family peroxiredoxin [Akkermansiaceae bacterium]NNM28080.1 OsmC family peroxiredoxin [Akkermansiaceae bacterium]